MKRFMLAFLISGNFGLAFAEGTEKEVSPEAPVLQEAVKVELTEEQKKDFHFAVCRAVRSKIAFDLAGDLLQGKTNFPSYQQLEKVEQELQNVGCSLSDWSDIFALRNIVATLAQEKHEMRNSERFNYRLQDSATRAAMDAYVDKVFPKVTKAMQDSFNNSDEVSKIDFDSLS